MSQPLPAFRCSTPPASISARSRCRVSRPMWVLRPDKRMLYITAREGLYRINMLAQGPIASANSGCRSRRRRPDQTGDEDDCGIARRTAIGMVAAIALLSLSVPLHAKVSPRRTPAAARLFQAVITEGGKTKLWLAGQCGWSTIPASRWPATSRGKRGRSSGCRATLEKAGGKLARGADDRVHHRRALRRSTDQIAGRYWTTISPAALITITGLANPDAKIEDSRRSRDREQVASRRSLYATPGIGRYLPADPSSVSIATACSGPAATRHPAAASAASLALTLARAADERAGMAHASRCPPPWPPPVWERCAWPRQRHIPCRRRSRRNRAPLPWPDRAPARRDIRAGCAPPPCRRRCATTLWPMPARVSCRAMASVSVPLR